MNDPNPNDPAPHRVAAISRWFASAPYAAALAAVAAATSATIAIRGWMGPSVSLLFFPAVVFSAMYGGYGPALFATVLSTLSLAFFLVSPYYSFDIGPDDVIRLGVFAMVAIVTASVSSARRRAEDAQHRALLELRSALSTLQKVSGWPLFVDVSIAGGASKLLAHAASVAGCEHALAVWEAEDEPWVYLATSASLSSPETVARYAPTELPSVVPADLQEATFVSGDPVGPPMRVLVRRGTELAEWRGMPVDSAIATRLAGRGLASAPFAVEHLRGRIFFSGLPARDEPLPGAPGHSSRDLIPLVAVVAREVGNSLERLHLHDHLQQIAIREDRIRVARDLHDGVLQSLTGVRLRLQTVADEQGADSSVRDRLLAVERAIAIEQRELRLFIEDLKPSTRRDGKQGVVAQGLEDLRARLVVEWNTPIAVRVMPADLSLAAGAEQTLRLMVREAVVNALKHAHPSRVSVDVQSDGAGLLRVVVANDGRGFPFRGRMEHDQLVAANEGPVSLRERLTSVGGTLAIESMPTGSRLELTLPV